MTKNSLVQCFVVTPLWFPILGSQEFRIINNSNAKVLYVNEDDIYSEGLYKGYDYQWWIWNDGYLQNKKFSEVQLPFNLDFIQQNINGTFYLHGKIENEHIHIDGHMNHSRWDLSFSGYIY